MKVRIKITAIIKIRFKIIIIKLIMMPKMKDTKSTTQKNNDNRFIINKKFQIIQKYHKIHKILINKIKFNN